MCTCALPGCSKPAKLKYCSRYCNRKHWNLLHPYKRAYSHLKSNAKRRGKPFDLTLEQFKHFAKKYDYLDKKGRRHSCYHIDRKDERLGYTIDNIQVLTNSENVRKYARYTFYHDPMSGFKEHRVDIISEPIDTYSDVPF